MCCHKRRREGRKRRKKIFFFPIEKWGPRLCCAGADWKPSETPTHAARLGSLCTVYKLRISCARTIGNGTKSSTASQQSFHNIISPLFFPSSSSSSEGLCTYILVPLFPFSLHICYTVIDGFFFRCLSIIIKLHFASTHLTIEKNFQFFFFFIVKRLCRVYYFTPKRLFKFSHLYRQLGCDAQPLYQVYLVLCVGTLRSLLYNNKNGAIWTHWDRTLMASLNGCHPQLTCAAHTR